LPYDVFEQGIKDATSRPLLRWENNLKAERRQYPRYYTPDTDFQVFSDGTKIMGKLVNISKGGLAVKFSPGSSHTADCSTVDITCSEPDRFHLSAIACKRTYDVSVLAEDQSFTGTSTRQCGVRFTTLTTEQNKKLDFLLDRYGIRITAIS
jgi:hypothetical protein